MLWLLPIYFPSSVHNRTVQSRADVINIDDSSTNITAVMFSIWPLQEARTAIQKYALCSITEMNSDMYYNCLFTFWRVVVRVDQTILVDVPNVNEAVVIS